MAAVAAGALLPNCLLFVFFKRPTAQPECANLAFTIPTWGIDGLLVDLMYRGMAAGLGDVVTFPVVLAKVCVDMLGYNPFIAAPSEVLVYEWKNTRISGSSVKRAMTWEHYRDKIVPTLLATKGKWVPICGNHLLSSTGVAVPDFQSRPHLLGFVVDLYARIALPEKSKPTRRRLFFCGSAAGAAAV